MHIYTLNSIGTMKCKCILFVGQIQLFGKGKVSIGSSGSITYDLCFVLAICYFR